MAKKGQVIQLQTEVNNDEDWEKLLQRDGLIVVDIYSEWCGPCTGMTATLKKLKLEIGGDLLQLAIAKADKITALERFRNKSEPSWMFIVNGKMVNFMFGANAPKLTRLIIDELKKENEAREGKRERVQQNIADLAEEEKERREVIEQQQKLARERELAKAAKDLYERRLAECHNILENLQHFGVIIVFPHARTMYHEAFNDLLGEAGLTIAQTEKITLREEQVTDLFFFTNNPFTEDVMEEILNDTSVVLLVKPIPARDVTEPTDELLLEVIYGKSKRAPGDKDSPAKILSKIEEEVEDEPPSVTERVGVWVPINELEKATALKLFFPKNTENYLIPEPEPEPPHYAVIFDAYRRNEIADLMDKYRDNILRFGFFTNEVPEQARLIAKNMKQYEKYLAKHPHAEEKMVIQLSKKKSECVLAFVSAKPQYISPNPEEGKRECSIFFPENYDEPEPEEEPEVETEKDDKKKKRGKEKASDRKSDTATLDDESLIPGETREAEGEMQDTADDTIVPPSQRGSMIPQVGPESEAASLIEPGTEDVNEGEPGNVQAEISPEEPTMTNTTAADHASDVTATPNEENVA